MPAPNWSDLAPRMASGLAMVALGLLFIWLGGPWWHAALVAVVGGMVWELVRMLAPAAPRPAIQMAVVAAACLGLAIYLPPSIALPLLLVPSMAGISFVPHKRTMFLTFTAMILFSAFGMAQIRDDLGMIWLGWLVSVVVATDVAGYFAGRLIGGPKFWPRVSPKKTWSGTVAGWIAAGITGWIFGEVTGTGFALVGISVGASMAAQMGDMAESGMKRRLGVKDASTLIPGHGGLLDRFDGMLGASLFLLLGGPVVGFPPGLGPL